jgi:hypothetical protein
VKGQEDLHPVADTVPDALVVLLAGTDADNGMATALMEAWAPRLPQAVFVILSSQHAGATADGRMQICQRINMELATYNLAENRLVLVGIDAGSTLVLGLVHESLQPCGLLAIADGFPSTFWGAKLDGLKIRLIQYGGEGDGVPPIMDAVHHMEKSGADVRAALVESSGATPAVLRLGGAYLAELVAVALFHPRHMPPPAGLSSPDTAPYR